MKKVSIILTVFLAGALLAACIKNLEESAHTIVLSAPENDAAYDLDAIQDITFSWSVLDDVDTYKIAFSLSDDMIPATTVEATASPHTVPAAELDEALKTLGMTDSETDTVYWSVRASPMLLNIETQTRALKLTRKPFVAVPVTGVTINAGLPSPFYAGATFTATATVVPADATNKAVTWTSSHPAIATVNANTGLITGVAEGTATITVTSVADNSKTDAVTVTVSRAVLQSFTVEPASLGLLAGGATATLTIVKTPPTATGTFTFASNNTSVVTVNDNGLVTSVGAGTGAATITVSGTGEGGAVTPVEVPVTVIAPLNRSSWTGTETSNANGWGAGRALDDDIDTEWHSGNSLLPNNPEVITVDMQAEKTITGFYFVHRQYPWLVGYPKEITIETSNDNSDWAQAWSNVGETGLPGVDADLEYIYRLPLASAITARYFRIKVVSTHRLDGNDHTYTYFAEVGAYNGAENPSETLVGNTPAHDDLTDPLTVKYVNADGTLVP